MPEIDIDALESWAVMAAEELQQFCDDAQEAAGNPDGTDQLPGVRQLIAELDDILKPVWLEIIADDRSECIAALDDDSHGPTRNART